MRAKAIQIHETGSADKLRLVETNIEDIPPGAVLLRQTAIGVNYIDTYHRSGLYPLNLPSGIGVEAAGVVEEVGKGVTHWQRVTGYHMLSALSAPTPIIAFICGSFD